MLTIAIAIRKTRGFKVVTSKIWIRPFSIHHRYLLLASIRQVEDAIAGCRLIKLLLPLPLEVDGIYQEYQCTGINPLDNLFYLAIGVCIYPAVYDFRCLRIVEIERPNFRAEKLAVSFEKNRIEFNALT